MWMSIFICGTGISFLSAVLELSMNRRKPVEGLSLTITCTSDEAITATVTFSIGTVIKGSCLSDGRCGSGISRYTVTQNRAQRTTTLTINSTVSSEDNGTWICKQQFSRPDSDQQAPPTVESNGLVLSLFATVLDWSSVSYNPSLMSLPSSVTPQGQVTVTVTTPCAAPAAVISWTYPQGVGGVPPSSTSSSQGSCQSDQVQTTNILNLPGNTVSLYNRQISLTVNVEHDSFDPSTYIKSRTTNVIQFPVPVSMVTMTNINSDNEKIGGQLGASLTLTCVTSPSFPNSTVTWSGLPSGTTPTVREETTSGVLVKTTSSVTFTLSRNDTGNVIQCTASNINGQPSPTSNRAVLEVWYGPDPNQISVTKPSNTVAIENRDLTLTCQTLTSVSPGVTFTWDYSDGSAITGGSTGSVTRSAGNRWSQTLTFQPIRSKTSIRCRVSNTRVAVTATGSISLDVKWPPPGNPSLSDFPSPMFSGDQQTIRCTVTGGNPLATITWSCYNTSNMGSESTSSRTSTREGLTTSSLTFLVTKQQNGQQCQCNATWVYGGYNKLATESFTVYYPPDTPTVTDPGTLCEGRTTQLTCSSSPDSGNPPATYYWTKNNVTMGTGSPYTFTPVKDDNNAQIRCAAGNAYTDRSGHSRPQSTSRQINVYYKPRITISPSGDQTKKEGQSLSLSCSADSNPDNAALSWTFKTTTTPGNSVVKTNLSRSDHEVYTCTGRVNTGSVCPGGSLQGNSAVSVVVNFAPDITFNPVDIKEGQPLTLRCETNGRPDSYNFGSFTQYWGDTEVDKQTGTKAGAVYIWTTQTATYLDGGVYECSVDNGVTDIHGVLVQRKNASVHVGASPKFTPDASQIIGAEVGSSVRLSQTFYNSNLNYTSVNWTFVKLNSVINESPDVRRSNVTLKKNEKEFKLEGFVASVNITNFREQDIGVYTVTVCNNIGCNSSNVNLTAAGPPLVPLDFTITNTTQRSISLRWKPNFPGGDFTQMFILHYRLQGSGDWNTKEYKDNPGGYVYADITDLQPGSVYEFKVKARNNRDMNNEGNFSEIVLGTTESLPTTTESPVVAIAAGAGVGCAAVVLIAVVVVVVVVRRRKHGTDAEKGSKLPLHENAYGQGEKPDMHDNVLYDTSGGGRGGERAVMEDNVLYIGSGDTAGDTGGAEYAVVHKKPKKSKAENETELYATPQKKKNKEKAPKAEKKKDKKKEKKVDKKQASPRKQKRSDVYENTKPGQFGTDANTYANAGFVGDENLYEEAGGATKPEAPAYGRDEDGLLYVGIDFSNQKPSQEVLGAEESTEYAAIAFGKVGVPLPPDEEEKDQNKK